jgi:UDP-N-acetylmuramate dehydrogenase
MNIEENISLKRNTSFGTETKTKYFVSIDSVSDITSLLSTHEWKDNKYQILGGGSNTLFTKDYDGIIVYNNLQGKDIIEETAKEITIKVSSGEGWDKLVMWSVDKNLWGIEKLALIPGTVGASAVQNIGAYGSEVKDVIISVGIINLSTGNISTLLSSDCEFNYRSSIFKNNPEYFITDVTFKLSKIQPIKESRCSKEVAEEIIEIRRSKLPDLGSVGMAGSFFKNPIVSKDKANELIEKFPDIVNFSLPNSQNKISAGWLIEKLGYKGIIENNIGTYPKHALIIVRYNDATGKQVQEFSEKIINEVDEKFGITLEPEVLII